MRGRFVVVAIIQLLSASVLVNAQGLPEWTPKNFTLCGVDQMSTQSRLNSLINEAYGERNSGNNELACDLEKEIAEIYEWMLGSYQACGDRTLGAQVRTSIRVHDRLMRQFQCAR
jgi:hypothetical protein